MQLKNDEGYINFEKVLDEFIKEQIKEKDIEKIKREKII